MALEYSKGYAGSSRLVALVFLLSCSGNGGGIPVAMDGGSENRGNESATSDLAQDIDSSTPDGTAPPDSVNDARAEIRSSCEPGSGCFLDPCMDNSQCESQWCVEHMGEGVCTESCQEECPQGWTCKPLSGADPDVVWICVSKYSNLCKPCNSGDNCKSPGGAEDICVSYGAQGSFCGGACTTDGDCPWGFSCKQVSTVDGIASTQCVADAGVCPCTPKSMALALWTGCQVTNEAGTCAGKRVCTSGGLSDCDARVPGTESCDGLDDDCDGQTDEPPLEAGEYKNLCDDGNPCTQDSCAGTGGCQHEPLSKGECKDDDACTVGDHCEDGSCIGLPVVCDDDDPCTDDSCDGQGGCVASFNQAICDDGNPCTVKDQCEEGVCAGFAVDCECLANADCKALDDGNPCNGALVCDTSALPFKCAVDPATVVSCPQPDGPSAICFSNACDPGTGKCGPVTEHEGYACEDGDACSVGDKCSQGVCKAGVAVVCNDGNPCTDDSCIPSGGCHFQPNAKSCNDGDPCTTSDQCVAGQCTGGPPPSCDDGNACTDDTCGAALGCMHTPNLAQCDDGNACTSGDHCVGGGCVAGGVETCNDGNTCTDDTCVPATGCLHTFNNASCEDGDACTLGDACQNGQCWAGKAIPCDDSNPCTVDVCSGGGCSHKPAGGPCDDGNACTTGDACKEGKCAWTALTTCDDSDPCTTDTCDPVSGCVHKFNVAPCDDGDPCTTGEKCALGKCTGGASVDCDDANMCTDDSCKPGGGCQHVPNAAGCDDKNACTKNDVCSGGICTGGAAVDCNDDNVCTTDSCDPTSGCVFALNTSPCDDGDTCTIGEKCALGQCTGGKSLVCEDSNPCTQDSCLPLSGCAFLPIQVPCDDGNACTSSDECGAGLCVPGAPLSCDDDNSCTFDTCHAVSGCIHFPIEGACSDGDACTTGDTCADGSCKPSGNLTCDDGNICTDDSCDLKSGCIFLANSADCDDGNACTTADKCSQGKCKGGAPPNCDDGNECTKNSCDSGSGCKYVAELDGTPCTQNGGTTCYNGNCANYVAGKKVFTYTGGAQTFQVPPGVKTVRVVVAGGGGGGSGSHYGGGGSGWVRYGSYDVSGSVPVTVGIGGNGGISGTNEAPGSPGADSSFGTYITAPGGHGGRTDGYGGGNGGSGGGGAGNAGFAGAGGSNGSKGQDGATYPGGQGGHYDNLSAIKLSSLTPGAGGAAGQSSHSGGGGAGGLMIDGSGPSAGNGGQSFSGKGGAGYGSGGGAGGYNGDRPPGGAGAPGVVYVEW